MPPRPGRPGAGAYLPPHLRNTSACSTMQQRSLDELAPHNMLIKLEYTIGGPFSLGSCPDNITEQQQHGEADSVRAGNDVKPQPTWVHLESPACPDEHQMSELLVWFAKACQVQQLPDFPKGDVSAVMSLPSSLSKYERARWHSAAQRLGLASASKGFGEDRFLQISYKNEQQSQTSATNTDSNSFPPAGPVEDSTPNEPARPAHTRATNSNSSAHKQQRRFDPGKPVQRHKQVWEWCQSEGGSFWNYSQGEIKEMLEVGADMPQELQQLIQKRETSCALCEALQQGDQAAALALLAAAPPAAKLGWVRDLQSGGYPAHIAAFHSLGQVIKQLISTDGVEVLQQHDARRSTPISLAQQRGHQQLAAELERIRARSLAGSSTAGDHIDSSSSKSGPDSIRSSSGRGFTSGRGFGQGRGSTVPVAAGSAPVNVAATGNSGQHVQRAAASTGVPGAADAGANGKEADADDTEATVRVQHTAQESPSDLSRSSKPSNGGCMNTRSNSWSASRGTCTAAGRAAEWQQEHYCSYDTKVDKAYLLFGSHRPRGQSSSARGGGQQHQANKLGKW